METFENLVRAEFTPKQTYLNTASNGLLPARTVTAVHQAVRMRAEGTPWVPCTRTRRPPARPSPGWPGCRPSASRPAPRSPSTAV